MGAQTPSNLRLPTQTQHFETSHVTESCWVTKTTVYAHLESDSTIMKFPRSPASDSASTRSCDEEH